MRPKNRSPHIDLTPALTYRRFFAELLTACPEHITANQRIRSFNSVTRSNSVPSVEPFSSSRVSRKSTDSISALHRLDAIKPDH